MEQKVFLGEIMPHPEYAESILYGVVSKTTLAFQVWTVLFTREIVVKGQCISEIY